MLIFVLSPIIILMNEATQIEQTENPRTETVVVEHYGFSNNPVYDALQHQLSELAGEWRTTKRDETVQQYHAVLKTLMLMGWRGSLDVENELPDELLPYDYLHQYD